MQHFNYIGWSGLSTKRLHRQFGLTKLKLANLCLMCFSCTNHHSLISSFSPTMLGVSLGLRGYLIQTCVMYYYNIIMYYCIRPPPTLFIF